jgi:methanogenic corrinoid protein MtbC1
MGDDNVRYQTAREFLINSIGDLKEDIVYELVMKRINSGDDPLNIIDDCQRGMRLVGERYEQGQYYIAGLIMAGEIFSQVMSKVQPLLKERTLEEKNGCILLGTVKDDIHDLGKNIVSILLRCHGFTVYDLGVDVPPAKFLEEFNEIQPDIVGLSGLLTSSYDKMKETISLLKNNDVPVVIGGGQVNEQIARLVGTQYWCNDAVVGVRICQRLISNI